MSQKTNDERVQGVNDKRAEDAYQFISEISATNKNLDDEVKQQKANKEFRSLARSFPTMVQNNGLNVAIAFLLSKTDGPHPKLYKRLGSWLEGMDWLKEYKNLGLMKKIVKLSRDEYRLTSQEVMAYSSWVKRFAEGRWNKDGEEKE